MSHLKLLRAGVDGARLCNCDGNLCFWPLIELDSWVRRIDVCAACGLAFKLRGCKGARAASGWASIETTRMLGIAQVLATPGAMHACMHTCTCKATPNPKKHTRKVRPCPLTCTTTLWILTCNVSHSTVQPCYCRCCNCTHTAHACLGPGLQRLSIQRLKAPVQLSVDSGTHTIPNACRLGF